jgi:hypothetical protein
MPNGDVGGGKIICGTIATVRAVRRVTNAAMAFKKTTFRRRAS